MFKETDILILCNYGTHNHKSSLTQGESDKHSKHLRKKNMIALGIPVFTSACLMNCQPCIAASNSSTITTEDLEGLLFSRGYYRLPRLGLICPDHWDTIPSTCLNHSELVAGHGVPPWKSSSVKAQNMSTWAGSFQGKGRE